jgi:hypothetical protein
LPENIELGMRLLKKEEISGLIVDLGVCDGRTCSCATFGLISRNVTAGSMSEIHIRIKPLPIELVSSEVRNRRAAFSVPSCNQMKPLRNLEQFPYHASNLASCFLGFFLKGHHLVPSALMSVYESSAFHASEDHACFGF